MALLIDFILSYKLAMLFARGQTLKVLKWCQFLKNCVDLKYFNDNIAKARQWKSLSDIIRKELKLIDLFPLKSHALFAL